MELNKTSPLLILISCSLAVLKVTNNSLKKTTVRQNEKLICIMLGLEAPKSLKRDGGAVILSLWHKSPHGTAAKCNLKKNTPKISS